MRDMKFGSNNEIVIRKADQVGALKMSGEGFSRELVRVLVVLNTR